MSVVSGRITERITNRRLAIAVIALSLLALAVRLYGLGHRVSHYDEARVGYWILQFMETGHWEYRPVVHGPFFIRINSVVFGLFGPSDFSSRLVVACIGGVLLPLSAWLFREHLRPEETVLLALILAFNPILLYYSRMMRNDVPLAAFMLIALGLFVRTYDTGKARYLYAGVVSLALGLTTKESALLWLLTFFGASALILDRTLLRERENTGTAMAAARSLFDRAVAAVRPWMAHIALAVVLFLTVIVFFYAPRAPNDPDSGLWTALGGDIHLLPAVIAEATLGSLAKVSSVWVDGVQGHPYLPYLMANLRTLAEGAPGVCVLAAVGFGYNRYAAGDNRDLIVFCFYSGVAAVFGYPLANLLPVSWSTIHAIVPLAVPAAVGGGVIYRWIRSHLSLERLCSGDLRWLARATAVAFLLTFLTVNAGAVAIETSYLKPDESPARDGGSAIVYLSQPPSQLQSGIDAIERAAARGGNDTDVLYVGDQLVMDESAGERPPAPGPYFARIPLSWYAEQHDAGVDSVSSLADAEINSDSPPAVLTTPGNCAAVNQQLPDGYVPELQLLDDRGDRKLVIFTNESGNGTDQRCP